MTKPIKVLNLTKNVPINVEELDKRKILYQQMLNMSYNGELAKYVEPGTDITYIESNIAKLYPLKLLSSGEVKTDIAEAGVDIIDITGTSVDINGDGVIDIKNYLDSFPYENTELVYTLVQKEAQVSNNLYKTYWNYLMTLPEKNITPYYLKSIYNDTNIVGIRCSIPINLQFIYFNANNSLIHTQTVSINSDIKEILLERADYMYFYIKYINGEPENIDVEFYSFKNVKKILDTDILYYNLENNVDYKINKDINIFSRLGTPLKIKFITPLTLYSELPYVKFNGNIKFTIDDIKNINNVTVFVKNSPIKNNKENNWYQEYLKGIYSNEILAASKPTLVKALNYEAINFEKVQTDSFYQTVEKFLESNLTPEGVKNFNIDVSKNDISIPLEYFGSQKIEIYVEFNIDTTGLRPRKIRKLTKKISNFESAFTTEVLNLTWALKNIPVKGKL